MVTSNEVMIEVASIFNITVDGMRDKCRLDEYIFDRKVFIYVCNKYLSISDYEISRKLNRERSLARKELKIIKRHMENKEPKWAIYWGKYERESSLLRQLAGGMEANKTQLL